MAASATATRKEKAPRKQRAKKEKHVDSDSDEDYASDVRKFDDRNHSKGRNIKSVLSRFPLGEFVRANREKSNLIGWRQTLASSSANHIRFLLVRANKFAKWKIGFIRRRFSSRRCIFDIAFDSCLIIYCLNCIRRDGNSSYKGLKAVFTWRICSCEQAKSECDWLVMSSVFVASQSSCFFLCFARTNWPSGKPALRMQR